MPAKEMATCPGTWLGRCWLRAAIWGCWSGACLAVCLEVPYVVLGQNLHTVIPGRVYRGAQQSGQELEETVRRYDIRTVVNLRGCCAPLPWYLDECRATHHQGIAQEDICFSAGRMPSIHELHRLLEVLDRSEYPLLIHCRRGADRTGLVSAVVLLLQTEAPWTEVRHQLGLRYGHIAVGRPAYLDQFLDSYAGWLSEQGCVHSSAVFRRWLEHLSCPGGQGATLEPLALPAPVRSGQPLAVPVRARNTGTSAWCLKSGSNAGIHAGYLLWNPAGELIASGRAGLFDATVAPGQSIDLTIALPALKVPGRYRLWVDMVDEQQCWFYQTGSEPLEQELEVRDEDAAAVGECDAVGLVGLAH
jgi:hypothetical protein